MKMSRTAYRVLSVNGRQVAEGTGRPHLRARAPKPERIPNQPKERRQFRAWLLHELNARGYALRPRAPYREIAQALQAELKPRQDAPKGPVEHHSV